MYVVEYVTFMIGNVFKMLLQCYSVNSNKMQTSFMKMDENMIVLETYSCNIMIILEKCTS